MKKSVKLTGAMRFMAIIAAVVAVGLTMSSCDEKCPACDSKGGTTNITINGLSSYNGKLGIVGFYKGNNMLDVFATCSEISSGTFSAKAECSDCGEGVELRGGGYTLVLLVYENWNAVSAKTTLYGGATATAKSLSQSNTLSLSDFIQSSNSIKVFAEKTMQILK